MIFKQFVDNWRSDSNVNSAVPAPADSAESRSAVPALVHASGVKLASSASPPAAALVTLAAPQCLST
jgi:hypothetical protein